MRSALLALCQAYGKDSCLPGITGTLTPVDGAMHSDILLWLFVINHGIAFGAGLYEQRIIRPQWFSRLSESGIRVNSAAMRSTDSGRRFWVFVTTVPLTLLALANLVAAWQSQGPRHEWWLGAAVITLVERITTF